MLNHFWAIFAKSKGDNSALNENDPGKTVFLHIPASRIKFAKFQANHVETEGKCKRKIIFGHFFQSPRAMTYFIRMKVASCTSATPDKYVCKVSSESKLN